MTRSREEGYLAALQKAIHELQKLDPYQSAYTAGCDYHLDEAGGHFVVPFFGQQYAVAFPKIAVLSALGAEADITTRLLVLHYLIHADGVPPADHWIAFRELPDGRIYDAAFQKRSPVRLAQEYGTDAKGFAAAALALGGESIQFGDVAYRFRLLPRLAMAVILHLGDEEFAPTVNVLFDAAAGHYLPTEDLAVLGGVLATKLIKAGNQ
jgi:hypothetical protein